MSQAVRISENEMVHLREAAALHSRSVAGQAEHWIRLGRLVERSPGFDLRRADAALAAMDRGDEDTELETLLVASLNLTQDPAAADAYAALGGQAGAVGYNEQDQLVERQKDGRLEPTAG